MRPIKIYFVAALTFLSVNVFAQTDKATTQKIVEAKTYTFVARSATPMNTNDISAVMSKFPGASVGGSINLTDPYYEVKVTPDSISVFLPYYGRSFSAPSNPNEGGVKFNTKKFEYKSVKGKKRGWNITINPSDTNEGYRMNLSIGESGYATLNINSNNKQAISYNGYLKENEVK
jgi:hypothetical protein